MSPADVAPPRPRGRVDLSAPRNPNASSLEANVSVVATPEGVVVAWVQGGTLRVQRRRGARWEPLGDKVNDRAVQGLVRALRAPDGGLVVAWTELSMGGPVEVRFSRWNGRTWEALLGPLNAPEERRSIADLAVTWDEQTPIVAMAVAHAGVSVTSLRAVRWSGARWELAGPPSLVAPDGRAVSIAATRCADGDAILGWVEAPAVGSPTLELRRWNAQSHNWSVLPRGNAPLVDGGTHAMSLACSENNELVMAYTWSGGTHSPYRWDPATEQWRDLGYPQPALRTAMMESGPLLRAHGDALWMAWRASSGRLSAAAYRGRAWRMVSESLDEPNATGGSIDVGADGALYTASRGEGRPVVVSFYEP